MARQRNRQVGRPRDGLASLALRWRACLQRPPRVEKWRKTSSLFVFFQGVFNTHVILQTSMSDEDLAVLLQKDGI